MPSDVDYMIMAGVSDPRIDEQIAREQAESKKRAEARKRKKDNEKD